MAGGLEVVVDNTGIASEGIKDAILVALEKIGLLAEGYAQMKCPVDTGTLRGSITHEVAGDSVYVGTNIEYAPYVELGTVRQAPQPYLRPAAQEHGPQYRDIIKSELSS